MSLDIVLSVTRSSEHVWRQHSHGWLWFSAMRVLNWYLRVPQACLHSWERSVTSVTLLQGKVSHWNDMNQWSFPLSSLSWEKNLPWEAPGEFFFNCTDQFPCHLSAPRSIPDEERCGQGWPMPTRNHLLSLSRSLLNTDCYINVRDGGGSLVASQEYLTLYTG